MFQNTVTRQSFDSNHQKILVLTSNELSEKVLALLIHVFHKLYDFLKTKTSLRSFRRRKYAYSKINSNDWKPYNFSISRLSLTLLINLRIEFKNLNHPFFLISSILPTLVTFSRSLDSHFSKSFRTSINKLCLHNLEIVLMFSSCISLPRINRANLNLLTIFANEPKGCCCFQIDLGSDSHPRLVSVRRTKVSGSTFIIPALADF